MDARALVGELPIRIGKDTPIPKDTRHFRSVQLEYRDGVLRWVVPPVVHQKVWKLGLMSATLECDLLRRVFPDAEVHALAPVDWVDGAKVYQQRTHKVPRRTVYERESAGELVGFSSTGERLWHLVEHGIRTSPEKTHGIISYKQVLEWIAPEIKELGIDAVANFGGLVGLDTKFENVDTLWILFSPELPPGEIEWRSKMVFGNDDTPLSFSRDDQGNWEDARVQQVYDAGVIAELVQAVGRARLVLYPKAVVILSAHRLPGITERAVLFDETDWEVATRLENLAKVVADREATAAKLQTVADFAQAYGCSDRQARRLWEQAGGKEKQQQTKAERNAEIRRRHAADETQQQIADALGIGIATVNRVLKS